MAILATQKPPNLAPLVTTKKISDQKFRLKETPKIVKNSWNRWKYGRFYKIHELFREINFTFREKYKKQLREGQT